MTIEPFSSMIIEIHPGDGTEHVMVSEDPDGLEMICIQMIEITKEGQKKSHGRISFYKEMAPHVAEAIVRVAEEIRKANEDTSG